MKSTCFSLWLDLHIPKALRSIYTNLITLGDLINGALVKFASVALHVTGKFVDMLHTPKDIAAAAADAPLVDAGNPLAVGIEVTAGDAFLHHDDIAIRHRLCALWGGEDSCGIDGRQSRKDDGEDVEDWSHDEKAELMRRQVKTERRLLVAWSDVQ